MSSPASPREDPLVLEYVAKSRVPLDMLVYQNLQLSAEVTSLRGKGSLDSESLASALDSENSMLRRKLVKLAADLGKARLACDASKASASINAAAKPDLNGSNHVEPPSLSPTSQSRASELEIAAGVESSLVAIRAELESKLQAINDARNDERATLDALIRSRLEENVQLKLRVTELETVEKSLRETVSELSCLRSVGSGQAPQAAVLAAMKQLADKLKQKDVTLREVQVELEKQKQLAASANRLTEFMSSNIELLRPIELKFVIQEPAKGGRASSMDEDSLSQSGSQQESTPEKRKSVRLGNSTEPKRAASDALLKQARELSDFEMAELLELKNRTRCPLCLVNEKDVAITVCMHCFCRGCVNEKIVLPRNRKCPLCGQKFAEHEVRDVYLGK